MSEEWTDIVRAQLSPYLQFKTDEEILAAFIADDVVN